MSEESEQDQNFIDGWPMNTPLDIRMGLTKEEGINHPLRWGIISASAIASDWIKSLQDVLVPRPLRLPRVISTGQKPMLKLMALIKPTMTMKRCVRILMSI